jgi:hypothetical protein
MKPDIRHPLIALALGAATTASAQDAERGVGYVGVMLSYGDVVEDRSPDSNVQYMPIAIEGAYSFPIFGNGMLGASLFFSTADWDETQTNFDADNPAEELRIGLHYTHAITPDLRVGGFGAFSRNDLVGTDLQKEPYDTIYGGLQAQYFYDDFMFFGQAGFGRTLAFPPDQSSSDPEGFEDGRFLRAGVTWFPVDSTAITFDFESAHSGAFLDGGADEGDFWSVGLSGETRLPTELPLTATYFVRHDQFEINGGAIRATDLSVGVGIRMLFGGGTPNDAWRNGRQLSVPRLPARAVDWLETLD